MLKLCWRLEDTFLGDISGEDMVFIRKNLPRATEDFSDEAHDYLLEPEALEYLQNLGMTPELSEMLRMALEEHRKANDPMREATIYIDAASAKFYLRAPERVVGTLSEADFDFLIRTLESEDQKSYEIDKVAIGYLDSCGMNTGLKKILYNALGDHERVFVSVIEEE